jgi:hypothetical protein
MDGINIIRVCHKIPINFGEVITQNLDVCFTLDLWCAWGSSFVIYGTKDEVWIIIIYGSIRQWNNNQLF